MSALPVLFILGWGAVFTYGACRMYTEWFRLGRYVQTTGTIRATDVQVQGGVAGHGGGQASFMPVVWYEYTVGGRTFTGYRSSITPIRTQSLAQAQGWIANVTAATPLVVWYDPATPEHAVLSKGFASQNMTMAAIMPLVTLGLGSALAIFFLRSLRSKRLMAA